MAKVKLYLNESEMNHLFKARNLKYADATKEQIEEIIRQFIDSHHSHVKIDTIELKVYRETAS